MHTPGINLLELETVDSTNTYAKNNFDVLADGTLICAEMQTAGRGRLGRCWISPAGVNIYASLVMKQINQPFYATAAASLAAQEMLLQAFPRGDFFIKWPNDIYSGHKKIAGILCEAVSDAYGIAGVIAGIGVNINLEQRELDRIDQPAASLLSLSGRKFDVKTLILSLKDRLAEYYGIYLSEPEKLFAEWKSRNRIVGRRVSLTDPNGKSHRVRVLDIAETGELIAEENGMKYEFNCGDVTLRQEDLLENSESM